VGCFDPEEKDGTLGCGAEGACPSGFVCAADGFCWRRGHEPDAMPLPACSNGIDDDCDGKIDKAGGDPGCMDAEDDDEHGHKRCDDGIDNDGDGLSDYRVPGCGPPGDPECGKPEDDNED
jgi:hypothetical protein